MRKPKRPAADPADELTMRVLLRLWAGDVPDLDPEGNLVLLMTDVNEVVPLPQAVLDDLEFTRRWVRNVAAGRRAVLTFRGVEALKVWSRRVQAGTSKYAMQNRFGDRIVFA